MKTKKTKHTPGPWIVGDYSTHGQFVYDPKGERIVAETYPDEHQDFEANARLIAAAPELLKALENLCSGEVSNIARKKYWDQARAIIAKATGEIAVIKPKRSDRSDTKAKRKTT